MASFNKIKTNSPLSELFGCGGESVLEIIKDAYLCRTETTK